MEDVKGRHYSATTIPPWKGLSSGGSMLFFVKSTNLKLTLWFNYLLSESDILAPFSAEHLNMHDHPSIDASLRMN